MYCCNGRSWFVFLNHPIIFYFFCQKMMLPSSDSLDLIRTLRMTGFGLLILGPSQHLWFNFVGKILPRRDVITTIKKLLIGQAIFGPCINSVFFSFNAALQGAQELWIFNPLTNTSLSVFLFFLLCQSGSWLAASFLVIVVNLHFFIM